MEGGFLPERDCDCPPECHLDYLDTRLEQSFWPSMNSFVNKFNDLKLLNNPDKLINDKQRMYIKNPFKH